MHMHVGYNFIFTGQIAMIPITAQPHSQNKTYGIMVSGSPTYTSSLAIDVKTLTPRIKTLKTRFYEKNKKDVENIE